MSISLRGRWAGLSLALVFGACADEGASTPGAVTVEASARTLARSEIARWEVSSTDAGARVVGLSAQGAVLERTTLRAENGGVRGVVRTFLRADGTELGTVFGGLEGPVQTPAGVCAECFADTQPAVERLLGGERVGQASQAVLGACVDPEFCAPDPGLGGGTSGGGLTLTRTVQVAVPRGVCGSCNGSTVTVCDYTLLGYCVWSHAECRSTGDASAACLEQAANHY